jgi:hypothetical protein
LGALLNACLNAHFRAIVAASRRLRANLARSAPPMALPGWRARFDAAVARTARREARTYFDETTLRRALER